MASGGVEVSTVRTNCPIAALSPSPTWTAVTLPARGEGISTTPLSISISSTGSSTAISLPADTSTATISPLSIPSPKAGRATSTDRESRVSPVGGGGGSAAGCCARSDRGASGSTARAGASSGAPPEGPSTVRMTWPTAAESPSATMISAMVPLTEEGTSMTALSVSSSMTGWSSTRESPTETRRLMTSPASTFSPRSGSLNSVAISSHRHRVRFFRIDAEVLHRP